MYHDAVHRITNIKLKSRKNEENVARERKQNSYKLFFMFFFVFTLMRCDDEEGEASK
jgi:hypothetical protein